MEHRWNSCVADGGEGGAAAGAKAGNITEHAIDHRVPKDDVQFYHQLLQRGCSLVIANAETEELGVKVESVLKEQGSEGVEMGRSELKAA